MWLCDRDHSLKRVSVTPKMSVWGRPRGVHPLQLRSTDTNLKLRQLQAQPSARLSVFFPCSHQLHSLFFPYSYQPPMDEPPSPAYEWPSPTDEPPSPLVKSRSPRKTIIVDHNLWESFVYICTEVWAPSFTLQNNRFRIWNLRPSLSSSKGDRLLSLERCDIWVQPPFLRKTWG